MRMDRTSPGGYSSLRGRWRWTLLFSALCSMLNPAPLAYESAPASIPADRDTRIIPHGPTRAPGAAFAKDRSKALPLARARSIEHGLSPRLDAFSEEGVLSPREAHRGCLQQFANRRLRSGPPGNAITRRANKNG